MKNYTETEKLLELEVLSQEDDLSTIVLFNDDVNTFEWVIECLVAYCQHDSLQAEQCATITHYTGKCIVKIGPFDKMKPICETLQEKGLTAEIQ